MQSPTTIDLGFQGFTEVIAAFIAPTGDGRFVLFESGPASTLDAVDRAVDGLGFTVDDLAAVFATHVHLDHSGGAGVLARRTGCTVYAHPAGVAHLIDPSAKLLPSAERLYGEMLELLWGCTEGVPSRQLRPIEHGGSVTVGDLEVRAWHTPGHATHHIAWQVGRDIVTGDVGGVRFPGAEHVLPPMPPPDIDVEAWRASLDLLRGLEPERLLLTHYGAFDDPKRHLDELEDRLLRWTEIAEDVVAGGGDREQLGERLLELDEAEIAAEGLPDDTVARYRRLCPMVENSAGLYRYVVKRRG
ncbi:MAG: MBL fold metallo-hydrolase [Holophagae bacterium]|jgi:glyoxylase-like metal-dependent hydrolase (beta-lactamase superfamily II)